MKPLLKWVGGKTQLLPTLRTFINKERLADHTYYEPFVGGGAVLFDTLPDKAVINDLNSELVTVYEAVRDNPEELIREIDKNVQLHIIDKQYYYFIRDLEKDPKWKDKKATIRAARTIYLNKLCFNGLYRVNSRGYFNVPLGRTSSDKLPDVIQADLIREMSDYLKNITILNTDYKEAVRTAKAGDIIYFDPPYDYEDEKGFTSYQKTGFTRNDLKELHDLAIDLSRRGCTVILSNNATTYVKDLFKGWNITEVEARRSVNSDASKRSGAKEVIIYNQ